jgi:hypothetical protein
MLFANEFDFKVHQRTNRIMWFGDFLGTDTAMWTPAGSKLLNPTCTVSRDCQDGTQSPTQQRAKRGHCKRLMDHFLWHKKKHANDETKDCKITTISESHSFED